jgi:hypothetical protein
MYVRVFLGKDLYQRLINRSAQERRPLPMQAEVELRRAMGLEAPAGPAPVFEVIDTPAGLEVYEMPADVLKEAGHVKTSGRPTPAR